MAGVISAAGALSFRLLVGDFPLARVLRPSLQTALLAGVVWLLFETATLAETTSLSRVLSTSVTVVAHTRFGLVLMARFGLLLLTVLLGWTADRGWRVAAAAICAAGAVALQAALGHAAASGNWLLIGAVTVHVLAVAAWLGALIPLFLALAGPAPSRVARHFSVVGLTAVAAIVASGLEQATVLIGGLAGLVGTQYGHVALVKIGLLSVLLCLAVVNRFVLTPALDDSAAARHRLRVSLTAEIALGGAVIAAAATLASLPPAIHEQPDWPFTQRLSLAALTDPDLRREVLAASGAVGIGIALLLATLTRRRLRWAGLAAALVIFWFAAPHFELLLVPAYPTTFYQSLSDFDGAGIMHGIRLFARNCQICHGPEGRGDGPLAKSLDIPPADLTADHLWAHTDGDLYWYLAHGIQSPRGGLSMPGFAGQLDSDSIWAVIDALHARNAGAAMQRTGAWPRPIPAPELEAPCGDGHVEALEDLRGRMIRIIAAPPPAPDTGIATIFLADVKPEGDECAAPDADTRNAYALVAGLTPAELSGTILLVDPAGWLRARIRPGDPRPDYPALIRQILATPLAVPSSAGHRHAY